MSNRSRPNVLSCDVKETLSDLTHMTKQVGEALNGREDLLTLWCTTTLQYSLVTTASGQYEHVGYIGAAAWQMVAANNNISICEKEAGNVIVNSLRGFPAHPDVNLAFTQLKADG